MYNKEKNPEPSKKDEPQRYALIVSGYTGDRTHAGWFRGSTLNMYNLLRQEYNFSPSNIYYLSDSTNYSNVNYVATMGNFRAVMDEIAKRATDRDSVFVYVVGHGNRGFDSKGNYALADGMISGPGFAKLLSKIDAKLITVIMTQCNSGSFIPSLSGENRIIIASVEATRTNSADFANYIIEGLRNGATLASAFESAMRATIEWYAKRGLPVAEHPLLDDNGDGVGSVAPLPNGGNGVLAAKTTLRT